MAVHSVEPAVIGNRSGRKLLKKHLKEQGLPLSDLDLIELNEAFTSQILPAYMILD